MAEAITVARPYANAVFEIAKDKGEISVWSELLSVLSACSKDTEMNSLMNSPLVQDEQVISVLSSVVGEAMTVEATNFLAVLAENKRLNLLGDIAIEYEVLREEFEKQITAEVITAKALTGEQEAKISNALSKRLDCDVTLNILIDESLLGGAIIRANDLVIDGSAVSKLNRLANVI